MGRIKSPVKVKLVVGLLGTDLEILNRARSTLKQYFGNEEEIMDPIPFIWTDYYVEEVGKSPLRCFISYEPQIARESIVDIKLRTNELESELSREKSDSGLRPVNIDPGYLTLGQFFLATTKDQRHRVYIRDGIFVEPTLYFESGKFHPFAWTYPDYRSEAYQTYFSSARSKLAYQIRNEGRPFSTRMPAREADASQQ